MNTLLLGMGNPILCDDAVGIRLARFMSPRLSHAPQLSCTPTIMEECSVGGLNILEIITGYEQLIILDSIKTSGASPGKWYRFTAQSLKETMNLNNVHDANFASALELGRRIGLPLPIDENIHIFAVEVLDNITFSEVMSPPLEIGFPEYAEEIFTEIYQLLS